MKIIKEFLKRFNSQEFLIGSVVHAGLVFLLGFWIIPVELLSAVLWSIGGVFYKPVRRFFVPIVPYLFLSYLNGFQLLYVLAVVGGIAVLHIGDGFPDHRPTTKDPGSALGRFVEKFIPEPELGGKVTKWLLAAIYQVPLILYLL